MKRRPNFSEDEKSALVNSVLERYELICGRFTDVITPTTKEDAWKEVMESVNCVSQYTRSLTEVKKKYQGLKKEIYGKAVSNGLIINGEIDSINFQIKEELEEEDEEIDVEHEDESQVPSDGPISENESNQSDQGLQEAKSAGANSKVSVYKPKPKSRQNYRRVNDTPPQESSPIPQNSHPQDWSDNFPFPQDNHTVLLAAQLKQLKRIGDLMEERNRIEIEKLQLKRRKMSRVT